MGKAVMQSSDKKIIWESSHPDTGEPIEGVVIPGLDNCIEGLLQAASHLPFCPCIGWDVVITEDGFSILEANPIPGLIIVQIHTPLLIDPRTRQFFQRWGVVAEKKPGNRSR